MPPTVSIVILNWNGKEMLNMTLHSIEEHTIYPDASLIVVDNGSTDGSVKMVRNDFPDVEVVKLSENLGFSMGNNIGIQYALDKQSPDYVLLLNNDIEIQTDGWLDTLVGVAKSKNAGVTGCHLVYPDGETQYCGGIVDSEGSRLRTQKCPTEANFLPSEEFVYGACMLISTETINQIGYLDEGFSPYNWEEIDYCMRCHAAGIPMVYSPKPTLVHHTGKSKEGVPDTEHIYINKKNQLRFCLLNFSYNDLLARFPHEVANLKQAILGTEEYEQINSLMERLSTYFGAYWNTIQSLPDIVSKRRNRTAWIPPEQ
jgi:GT2 family glycosyltransferase